MIESPFFSILIATYNSRNKLERCITSINSQNFTNYELLVSDGGSTDATLEYLCSNLIRNLVWHKSGLDSGIYDALNMALENATGKWVLVLGSDDALTDDNALERAFLKISSLGNHFGIIYSNLMICTKGASKLKIYPELEDFDCNYGGGACIHHQSAFIERKQILRSGKFSTHYKLHADYDLIMSIRTRSLAIKIDDAFVCFNKGGSTSKLSNLLTSINEVCAIRAKFGLSLLPRKLLFTYIKVFFYGLFSNIKYFWKA